MGRARRCLPTGTIAHVLNRAVDRQKIFLTRYDYDAFLDLLEDTEHRDQVEVLGYCVMPNHWHLVLRAMQDRGISLYVKWLAGTHALRYRKCHGTLGHGHLYQGRFRAFPIDDDSHFLAVLRYVEANPCKAHLVWRAEDWEWSSAFERGWGRRQIVAPLPVPLPQDWHRLLNLDAPDLPPGRD